MRRPRPADALVTRLDTVLRAATRSALRQRRPYPAATVEQAGPLDAAASRHAAGLMRVNHAGEVCAQALYVGQALLARRARTRERLLEAAREEGDHLFWCEARLAELGARPSRLDPFWFTGALAIGMSAAALGDRASLGFVEETERQVVRHLEGHLDELPPADRRSRAVVEEMRADEARHAEDARARGALPLPWPVRRLMRLQARVMTTLAYWI
ncbi:MAG: 2-polyprenyl-3-methyl-6-methoxy-1,4-benzoquinone monooxygenase [Gammaproteobacteria bacterium]|nr:2-polyprenyl-3-methyl-6-methoxy-1,4-benzoquinone monooxygenase [Gammaproteobacteria bacterium]MCP5201454.1 2-polyprenyl-3-methyl-6-methoxy-1,4-benzoquinone monooxygenase [Gammaproteobacteria bacterium]